MKLFISSFLLIFCILGSTFCWDNAEMQMFDLVEEVNQNFYEYLGLDQNATSTDIRRAYRKLSLIHHPDKNPESEDAIKFRRLVAVYEILRDDKMRERYNEVLKYGLPDWKMPSYYFRKLRKMSFGETFLLFSILATLIHYACLWGAFFEQKLNMEYYLFRNKKKRNIESEMNEQLNTVYKPRWKDILPLAIVKFVYYFIVTIPQNIKFLYGLIKKEIMTVIDKQFEQKRKDKARQEEKKKLENIKKQKKERKQVLSKENKEIRKIYEIGKQNAMTLPVETFNDIPIVTEEKDYKNEEMVVLEPWTDKNTVVLIRALSKFPAGVNDRWLKISDFVKRPLSEVVKKVKEIQACSKEKKIPINTRMQNSLGDGVEEAIYIQAHLMMDHSSSESESIEDEEDELNVKSSAQKKKERKKMAKLNNVISVPISKIKENGQSVIENEVKDDHEGNEEECSVNQRKKPRTKVKYTEASESTDTSIWTQIEQKQLEDAMRSFPKGTTDRWDRISQKIPTKSKVECIERIKKLSQSIQEKKQ